MSADIKRFQITWKGHAYRVSIPNYDGGEVVKAEHYDRETGQLLEALRTALKWAEQDINFAKSFDRNDIDRVLEHWE